MGRAMCAWMISSTLRVLTVEPLLIRTRGAYQVTASLGQLAEQYKKRGFFRCAKAMVVNIYKIQFFKSQAYARIEATLANDEKIIISRKYANKLRQVFQEGMTDER